MTEAPQSTEPDETGDQSFEEVFDKSVREDPLGDRLLDRLELLIFVLGSSTTVLTLLVGNLSITIGWAVGWLVGQLSVGISRRLTRRLLASRTGSGATVLFMVLKTTLLLVGIWVALRWTGGHVIAFACGYGLTVTGLVVGSVLCGPRQRTGTPSQGTTPVEDDDHGRG